MTDEATVPCLGCGQPMPPRAGLAVCSDACRQREWRSRRRRGRRQLCVTCGNIFAPFRRDAIFCSVACSQKDYRRRKAAGPDAPPRARAAQWLASEAVRPPNTGEARKAAPGAALGTADAKRIDDLVRALIG
jgi:predicted nucleic acid-binding Zn ribbon protein